jgi:hypothetical protein
MNNKRKMKKKKELANGKKEKKKFMRCRRKKNLSLKIPFLKSHQKVWLMILKRLIEIKCLIKNGKKSSFQPALEQWAPLETSGTNAVRVRARESPTTRSRIRSWGTLRPQ